jgi:hypothetical protein
MIGFKYWLKENGGPVYVTDLANTAVDDGFAKLKSKYMANSTPQSKINQQIPFDTSKCKKKQNKK